MRKILLVVGILLASQFAFSQVKGVFETTSDNFKTLTSLTVVDVSVSIVLDQLAEKAGVNLVQGAETKDKLVTLSIKDIPVKDALDLVIRATDLGYLIMENSIIVASNDKIEREIGLTTSVYDLQYAEAAKAKEMLSDISKKIKVDDIGNRLIYQASPKKAKEIEKVLSRIDRPLQQVLFKSSIKEVSYNRDEKYGLDWGKLSNYSTTIREGSYGDWGKWDYEDPEYDTETGMITKPGKWTFSYDGTNPLRDLNGDIENDQTLFSNPNGSVGYGTTSGLNTTWHRVISQEYLLWLDFQLHDGDATVLAQPEIATLNNEEAQVLIGEKVPYTVTSIEQGTSKQNNMFAEVGIKLKVKPIINEENDITVTVETEVSSIKDWKGTNQDVPWIAIREAKTSVRVKDGETIQVGGMLSEEETTSTDKFPLLGDIPYLGYLFQHVVKTKKTTNLIIEVTPYILVDGKVIVDEGGESEVEIIE